MALIRINNRSSEDTAIHGRRNLVINGAMQVAQRGTSSSFAHDGTRSGYTVDRFESGIRHTTDEYEHTIEQVSDAPSGFSYSLKWTTTQEETTVGADEYYYIRQAIEAQNLQHLCFGSSAAKQLTLSFWVKSSITGTYGILFFTQDPTRGRNATYTIDSADTWEYKTITIEGDTTGAIANDNGQGLDIYWGIASGSDFNSINLTSWDAYTSASFLGGHAQNGVATTASATWQITSVQLEVGDTATPFEHRSYGEELALCQRYCQFFPQDGTLVRNIWAKGDASGSGAVTSAICFIGLQGPTMRTDTPTLVGSDYTQTNIRAESGGTITTLTATPTCLSWSKQLWNCSFGSADVTDGTQIRFYGSTDDKIGLDAEL